MSESFAPLVPATAGSKEAAFTAIHSNGVAPGTAPSAPAAPGAAGSGPEPRSKPVVTLRRNGEVVSGIRIQCGCGQVVNLDCVY
jgi:hypothetical protein